MEHNKHTKCLVLLLKKNRAILNFMAATHHKKLQKTLKVKEKQLDQHFATN